MKVANELFLAECDDGDEDDYVTTRKWSPPQMDTYIKIGFASALPALQKLVHLHY